MRGPEATEPPRYGRCGRCGRRRGLIDVDQVWTKCGANWGGRARAHGEPASRWRPSQRSGAARAAQNHVHHPYLPTRESSSPRGESGTLGVSRGGLMARAGMPHSMRRRIRRVRGAPRALHLCTNTRVGAPRDACAARVRHMCMCRRRKSVKRGSGINVRVRTWRGQRDFFWRGDGRARRQRAGANARERPQCGRRNH